MSSGGKKTNVIMAQQTIPLFIEKYKISTSRLKFFHNKFDFLLITIQIFTTNLNKISPTLL